MDATTYISSWEQVAKQASEYRRREGTSSGLGEPPGIQFEVGASMQATRLPLEPPEAPQSSIAAFAESFFGMELPSQSGGGGQHIDKSEALARQDAAIDRDAEHRLWLLVHKQLARAGLSHEQEARLVLLTQRLRTLLPRVTQQDVEVVEALSKQLEDINAWTARLRADLDDEDGA